MKIPSFGKVRLFLFPLAVACAPMATHAGMLGLLKTLSLGILLLGQQQGVPTNAAPTLAPTDIPIPAPTHYPTAAPLCQFPDSMLYTLNIDARYLAVALRDDNEIILLYEDDETEVVYLAFCKDGFCITPEINFSRLIIEDFTGISLKLNNQSNPVFSYYGSLTGLQVVVCQDAYCQQNKTTILNSNTNIGGPQSLQINSQNYPVVSYTNSINSTTHIVLCEDPNCVSYSTYLVKNATQNSVTSTFSLQLNEDDLPYISVTDNNSGNDMKLIICHTKTCNETTIITDIESDAVYYISFIIHEGKPIITYSTPSLSKKIAFCSDPVCSNITITILESGDASIDAIDNLQISPVTNLPVIADSPVIARQIRLILCENPLCTARNIFTIRTNDIYIDFYVSLLLDSNGFPVIVYVSNRPDLEIIRCYDQTCSDIIENPVIHTLIDETTVKIDPYFDFQRSNVTDKGAIAYYLNDSLHLTTCQNDFCTLSSDVKISSASHNISHKVALQYNPLGYPIITYQEQTNHDLGMTTCYDPPCLYPFPTSTILADGVGSDIGKYTSLQIRSNGNPVIAYFNDSLLGLNLMICNDLLCDDHEVVFPLANGYQNRLRLDAQENPVIVYYNAVALTLNLGYCDDLYCTTSNVVTLFNYSGGTHGEFSFQLNGMGYPVISYYEPISGLWLKTCHNRNCTLSNTTLIEGNNAGRHNDLQLDKNGYPMISYYHIASYLSRDLYLKLAVCGNALCTNVKILEIEQNTFSAGYTFNNLTIFTKLQIDDRGNAMLAYVLHTTDPPAPRYFLKVATAILNLPYLGCENATYSPTTAPSSAPTYVPTEIPSISPTKTPTNFPTSATTNPTKSPTSFPTSPTNNPSMTPTLSPSIDPSKTPTLSPSMHPTKAPTLFPSMDPSRSPTSATNNPSMTPTLSPSIDPSKTPTLSPSMDPSKSPTNFPTSATNNPSKTPTQSPSIDPSNSPTNFPTSTTDNPSMTPTLSPSMAPSNSPTNFPTSATNNPSMTPTLSPSMDPSNSPTNFPTSTTNNPSMTPTQSPSMDPSNSPTNFPTSATNNPSMTPTDSPSMDPSNSPTNFPTSATNNPSMTPTDSPSIDPSNSPTNFPTSATNNPSMTPTDSPSIDPSNSPTNFPTSTTNNPSMTPTDSPSMDPSNSPTNFPTSATNNPSMTPTDSPSMDPSNSPTSFPTGTLTDGETIKRVVISDHISEEGNQESKDIIDKILGKHATEGERLGIIIGIVSIVVLICGICCRIIRLIGCRKRHKKYEYTDVDSHIEMVGQDVLVI